MRIVFNFHFYFLSFLLFITYDTFLRDQSLDRELDGRVEPSMTGTSALKAAARTQIDLPALYGSPSNSQLKDLAEESDERRQSYFCSHFSFFMLTYSCSSFFLILDRFLDRQHARTCSCLVILHVYLRWPPTYRMEHLLFTPFSLSPS